MTCPIICTAKTPQDAVDSTRNVVETAIDLSKMDKTSTWDELGDAYPHNVSRWEPPEGNKKPTQHD